MEEPITKENFQRKQFTFYRSFANSIRRIRDETLRCQTYDLVIDLALDNILPDMDALTDIQQAVLDVIMPFLATAREKAFGGAEGGKKSKRNKDTVSISKGYDKQEQEEEQEKDKVKEKDKDKVKDKDKGPTPPVGKGWVTPREGFQQFWNLYPKKVDYEKALEEYSKVSESHWVLMEALQQQIDSEQWQKEDGRYVMSPARWLREQHWHDRLPPLRGGDVKASGQLGHAEWDAIEAMMAAYRTEEIDI